MTSDYITPRHPTPYCRNTCQEFRPHKKRNHSIYEENCRCHNCESYIPRDLLLDKETEGVKAKCPCCLKTWLKGVHVGMGMRRLQERAKLARLEYKIHITGDIKPTNKSLAI